MENFVFGGISAGLAICIVNPFDVVKSRMQMQTEGAGKVYTGTFSALRSIAKQEGMAGLYRGLLPAIWFQVSLTLLLISFFETL